MKTITYVVACAASLLLASTTILACSGNDKTAEDPSAPVGSTSSSLASSFALLRQESQGISGKVGDGDMTVYFETRTPAREEMTELRPGAELPVSVRIYDSLGYTYGVTYAAHEIPEWREPAPIAGHHDEYHAHRMKIMETVNQLPALIAKASFDTGLERHRRGILETLSRRPPQDAVARNAPSPTAAAVSPADTQYFYFVEMWTGPATSGIESSLAEHTAVRVYEQTVDGFDGRVFSYCNHGDCPESGTNLACSANGQWGIWLGQDDDTCDSLNAPYSVCSDIALGHNCNTDSLMERERFKDRTYYGPSNPPSYCWQSCITSHPDC